MSSQYEFVTVWRVAGTLAEVTTILGDARTLTRWWPAVYLEVEPRDFGGTDGVGAVVDLFTKGWLPYTLRWSLTITEPVTITGFALRADGDLCGTGRWTFDQEGPEVVVRYDWRVNATKPLLRNLTWLLRPVFSANHQWAMARGEESLRLELRRRRAVNDAARASIPPPPPATFQSLTKLLDKLTPAFRPRRGRRS